MNDWPARASRWQLGLVMGLSAGIGAGVLVGLVFGGGWSGAVTAGTGAAVGGALLGTTVLYGQIRRRAEAVGVLAAPVRRAAGRAYLRLVLPRRLRGRIELLREPPPAR